MKTRILSILLLTVCSASLISGCALRTAEQKLDSAENAIEEKVDKTEEKIENAITPPPETSANEISIEEAQTIALEHAGFDISAVTGLHSKYEVDDGIPHYDVKFHQDYWEYEYEIHAETGNILSFEKDD